MGSRTRDVPLESPYARTNTKVPVPRPVSPLHACLVIACAMHVTASLALAHVHRERAPATRARAESSGEVAIEEMLAPELEPTVAKPDVAEPHDPDTRAASRELTGSHPSLAGAIAATPLGSARADTPSDVLARSSATSSNDADGWTLQTTRGAPNLWAGATGSLTEPHDLPPRANAGEARRGSRTGGLVEGLDASDSAKGLGRGGPVLSAVEDAAHSADAPGEGFAEYEVVVRRAGPIDVFLLRSNDDRDKWLEITPAIREGVSARHVLIPEGSSGMRFVVHVDAVVQFPDGKRRADLGNKTIATTGWGGKDAPGLSSPGVPMVGGGHTGKVCSVGAAVAPGFVMLGGACSPENVGSPAVRMVHGRVLSESRID
jgi:hypothetical protein